MKCWLALISAATLTGIVALAQQSDEWRYGAYDKLRVKRIETAPKTPPPEVGGALIIVPPHTNSTSAPMPKLDIKPVHPSVSATNQQAIPKVKN